MENYLAGRHGLDEYCGDKDSDPRHVLSCIKKVHDGIGYRLFKSFVAMENVAEGEGLDDVWSQWCPSPVPLAKQDYPAGAIPLWSNGTSTVYCKIVKDSKGFDAMSFSCT